jgi:hypothetical protein
MARKASKLAESARLACEKWREHFKFNIDQYHEMHTFVLGQQWTDDEEDEMIKTFRKVPLMANKLGAMANSLLGEQQQNTPQLQIVPMTNCDQETAHLREIIVKDIMYSTNATIAYQVAAGQSAIGGYSAFYVGTDYAHQQSFDLDICYGHFKDATRTYFDIGAEEPNKTDGMHSGWVSRITREKFRKTYGKDIEEKISKTMSPTATKEEIALAVEPNQGEDPFNWADGEGITLIHHFVRKYQKDTLYKLSNGRAVNQEELDKIIEKSVIMNQRMQEQQEQQQKMQMMQGEMQNMQMQEIQAQQQMPMQQEPMQEQQPFDINIMTLFDDGQPVRIEDSRTIKAYKIKQYVIAGDYILEEADFPSERLPLVFVDQNSYYDKTGKQICRSFFGDCKDIQRYINYLRTQSAYILKVSRYDQWLGSKKNVQGQDTQQKWANPNNIQGILTYDESPSGAKPEQIRPPELSQSLSQQYEMAINDLYLATGLYPTKLGQAGNEVSGAAIDARTRQGSYSTYVFFNSINRAITTGGSIVNEMIPRVYDSERVIALMMPEEGMKNITINKQMDEYGERIENDIRKGTYEVRLKAGASYEGQKAEALQSLREVLQVDPQAFNLIADLYADNLPLANNIEIKNRLKTMVSPQIIQAGKTGKMPQENGQEQPTPEQQQMAMQQQQMQMEQQFKQKQIEIKEKELQLKAQQMQIDLEIEHEKLQAEKIAVIGEIEESKMRYMAETQRTESDASISHANNLVKILTHKIG